MEINKKIMIIRLIIYSLTLLIPFLAMLNCSGWSARSMEVSTCFIDITTLRDFSTFCYNWLYFSVFMAFIPVVVSFLIVVAITEFMIFIIKIINKKREKSN